MGQAAYLGSSLHISCGKELTRWERALARCLSAAHVTLDALGLARRWEEGDGRVDMELQFGARGEGHVCLFLPNCRVAPPRAQGTAYKGDEVLPLCKQGPQLSLSLSCVVVCCASIVSHRLAQALCLALTVSRRARQVGNRWTARGRCR